MSRGRSEPSLRVDGQRPDRPHHRRRKPGAADAGLHEQRAQEERLPMTSPSMSTTVGDSRDERQPRSTTLAQLVGLLVELPAPIEIMFEGDMLRLYLADGADFDRWAAWHNATVHYRNLRHENTLQCYGYASWRGWHLSLTVCQRVQDELLSQDEANEALSAVTA